MNSPVFFENQTRMDTIFLDTDGRGDHTKPLAESRFGGTDLHCFLRKKNRRAGGLILQMAVDVFAVTDFYNHNEQDFILDLIDNAVIA